jgi:hypothetical protein
MPPVSPWTAGSVPEALEDLARRVARLRPCWRDPERFFEARSEIAAELRRMARQGVPEASGRAAGLPTRPTTPPSQP